MTMSFPPETASRIAKLEKNVEEIRDALRDNYFDKQEHYINRINVALKKRKNDTILLLYIDGFRSLNEIEKDLTKEGQTIPTTTLWRSSKRLVDNGLISKIGVKGISPIYDVQLWIKLLKIKDYIRRNYNFE